MGANIAGQLRDQRETIVTTQGKIIDVKQLTSETHKTLAALRRKQRMEVVCLYMVIAILGALVLLTAYRELTHGGHLL